ncbi:MAG TPA: FAD-dependent oxidoreductase [Terriglobales bacterium]|nr:FAD-dependent oxidoreductase [Terriglobales bacterium]
MKKPHVAVIGAGAFGGWTALYLLRGGAKVTLVDAWGPGNSRASSGGETRVIRGTYGPKQPYTRMAARAIELWSEHEQRWKCRIMHRIGVLWMAGEGEDDFERGSLPELRDAGIRCEELSRSEMKKRWPQIYLEDVPWGIFEPDGGFLYARRSCQLVAEGFVAEGGEFRLNSVEGDLEGGRPGELRLSDGSTLTADACVFACGPWLGKLFPQTVGARVKATRQEVFFFGTPAGNDLFSESKLPVWGEHRAPFMYGIPANDGRGFKMADDTRGEEFDPTSGERLASEQGRRRVSEYLGYRFPGMKGAPLVETRVCQYEQTPDSHFIVEQHPAAGNIWIVGGGSGHGFKHGPALGEMVAARVLASGL